MSTRELIFLTPYRLPTTSTLYLGDEEVAAFLNGYLSLWHPAALAGAARLPRLASPYDHEQPTAGHVYSVPEHPPLTLPDDWERRVQEAGAAVFKATADRDETLANLGAALATLPPATGPALPAHLGPEQVAPFLGIGFGLVQLEALFEAMSHDNLLAHDELWQEVRAAVEALAGPGPDSFRTHLQAAADRLLSAREVVYPVTVHVIDLALLDGGHLDAPWPAAGEAGLPWNLLACGALLERLARDFPDRLAALREWLATERVEVVGGVYQEREDPFLPLESQLWNLLHGRTIHEQLLGQPPRVFGRRRSGFHPQLPMLLQNVGLARALLVAFDDAVLPSHRSPVVSWPSPDGKQVDAFTRTPQAADSPQTYFNLAHHLHESIMQDQSATLALVHRDNPAGCWYRDWLELSRFAPVLGRWTTLSAYFGEVPIGDYTAAASPDDFQIDYLVERTSVPPAGPRTNPFPVSGFAGQLRDRRRVDAAWTLAALLQSLGGEVPPREGEPFETFLTNLEDRFESGAGVPSEELAAAQEHAAAALAQRLLGRAAENTPGFLVLNPCGFTRRVALELPGVAAPLPLVGPLKACQVTDGAARVVVEVPPLGFAWVPRTAAGAATPPARMRLADDRCVRNEFFEAEVDPQTGGLRAIRDMRTRLARLGQQLVYNPGSVMRASAVKTTSMGPALGEIVSEGTLLAEGSGSVLARFRQRFRAWLGRPVLELRIEIEPVSPPEGYPWHAYFGARFAWRDERSVLLRGSCGFPSATGHTRPESPEFLEVRHGRQNVAIFPGGLPFHQRHGTRMVDVLLVTEGESATRFDLGLGVDRENPPQTALGMVSPVAVVPAAKGPPHVGAAGWLFHLDAANLMLTSFRPLPGGPGVVARLLEVSGRGGPAEFRCVRDPVRAQVVDGLGHAAYDATTQGDAVQLEVAANDLVQLRIDLG